MRRVTKTTCLAMKRRAAVEPVIGHDKAEHRMERNDLMGRDYANAVLDAASYNYSLRLKWFEALICALITTLLTGRARPSNHRIIRQQGFFTVERSNSD